jgi:hypothetical protein
VLPFGVGNPVCAVAASGANKASIIFSSVSIACLFDRDCPQPEPAQQELQRPAQRADAVVVINRLQMDDESHAVTTLGDANQLVTSRNMVFSYSKDGSKQWMEKLIGNICDRIDGGKFPQTSKS